MNIQLRDYQAADLAAARALLRKGVKRLIVSEPTGAGKTELAMALIQVAADKGSRVSFIADRRSLIQQTSQRFTAAGIQHGILMGDDTVGTYEPVRVESAQTIQSRGLRDNTDLFVMDEIHEVRPDIIKQIAESGAVLVGLTATPFPAALADPIDAHLPADQRTDDAPPRYEAMVSTVTTDKLIADGHLCPFDVVAPVAVVDTSGLKVQGGEFHKAELKDRIMRIVGEIVPTWRAQLDERYGGVVQPTIVFGATVDDAEALQREFRDAGYDARLVSYREDDDENVRTIKAFRKGEFPVLVNSQMLSRGMDFPRLVIIIDAYPMRKILTVLQRLGRFMRTFPGKAKALLIDHAENWLHMRDPILAFYTGGPEWPPPEAANKSARDKKPDHDSICKSCRTVMPPGATVCPGCGQPRPVRTYGGAGSRLERVDGNLKLIDSVTGAASVYGGALWPEVCTVVSQRVAKGEQDQGRLRKLASVKYKAITGQWPKGPFRTLDRPADPAVADLMRRHFQAWIIARKAAGGARA